MLTVSIDDDMRHYIPVSKTEILNNIQVVDLAMEFLAQHLVMTTYDDMLFQFVFCKKVEKKKKKRNHETM